jgi:DNA repair exonuclease SbcCD nuclease subunit
MLIPFINDTHFGFKNDSQIFREYFNRFFKDIFFPYVDANNIKELIHLGDLMDRRKYVNFETLKFIRENFIEELHKRQITMHIILGNHDVYYKNTNSVNSVRELFNDHPSIKLYEKFQDADVAGFKFAMIPWICPENQNEFDSFVHNSSSTVAVGHLELQGFEVLRGIRSEEGMNKNILEKFQNVYSGHFHQKNDDGHIFYLGTQYDMTFADVDERKGFHVFDTETRSVRFIENPQKMFYRLIYDDINKTDIPDFSRYEKSYVKLVVKNKKYPKLFDKYIGKLYDIGPHEVNIIEEYELADPSTDDIDITQDTLSIIYGDIDDNKNYEPAAVNSLKKIMTDLYLESFEVD